MPEEIVMPRLSDTMEEGTIARWLKREGDLVHRGEPILEIETDKTNMELEAYSDGVIQHILLQDGATALVGTVIGLLIKSDEAATDHSLPRAVSPTRVPFLLEPPKPSAAAASGSPGVNEPPAPLWDRGTSSETPVMDEGSSLSTRDTDGAEKAERTGDRIKATPLARNLAHQYHIDLAPLSGRGSGPGGRIVKLDIEHQTAPREGGERVMPQSRDREGSVLADIRPALRPQSADDDVELRVPNRVQQVMARRVLESKTTVPHFYVTTEVDMAAAGDLRKQLLFAYGDEGKVTYNDLIVRACALGLRAMPEVNTSWRDGQFAVHSHVNIGIAVGLRDGLVVPVLRDADRKSLRELAAASRALIDKARNGKLTQGDMAGGTFTVSNLGMFDVDEFQAIINPPESAILAVGSILEKPVALDGKVEVRPRLRLTLSVDHRVIPGIPAAQFLQTVKQLLQEPLRLGF
jgi:pyruvate dehydrogenase E2 component (dihydrolipoamide acetyltransferase)